MSEPSIAGRLRAIVVDDEPLSRRAMRQLLDARADVEVVTELDSAVVLESAAEGVDVIFLDVAMPLRSGIDAASALVRAGGRSGPPFVVFVTAHDEFAPAAFDQDAVDYLTKPVTPARLARAIARVHERLHAAAALATDGRPAPATGQVTPTTLVARIGTREIIIQVADIELLEADGVYAAVHVSGRRYLLRRSLNDLERTLGSTDFVRVHRSYLVRRSAIVELRPGRGGAYRMLVLASGAVVPISRRQHASVMRAVS